MKIKHYLTIATLFFLAAMNLSAKNEHKTVNDIPYRDSAGESAYALERCCLDVHYPVGDTNEKAAAIIDRMHRASAHKRAPSKTFENSRK